MTRGQQVVRVGAGAIALLSLLGGVRAIALNSSVGDRGIDALRLHQAPYSLTGRKIAIGQVEIGRPAQFGLDKTASQNFAVRPWQALFRTRQSDPNENVDRHAASVASVMISNDKAFRGVAPDARLHAAAAGSLREGGQMYECQASQAVAQQNGGDVRAINFSFGESLLRDPRPDAMLDGNALLTQCIDWSARVHNVLYVIAGNQGQGGIPIPTDNFNGMVIANSIEMDGVFRKVSFADLGSEPPLLPNRPSESNVGPRRSVTLTAPGTQLRTIDADGSASQSRQTGTSFAAPHVVATVALLQEWGDRQLAAQVPQWSLDARRHEVMKAVLMNAADKLQDTGDGLTLGMSRTAVDQRNQDWLSADAFLDETKPLNANLGTGHLNAYRAWQQFSAGQWSAAAPVAPIGWDYSTVGSGTDAPVFRDYEIEQPLQAGSYVSASLAWNRHIELNDANRDGGYTISERFVDRGLNILDLYLMPIDEADPANRIRGSFSDVDSVEHIFHPVPKTGRYKLRVVFRQQVNDPVQPYALAWWTAPAQP
ncbi:MAG: S8 family serine peptidase [Kaiparowitsia implicata GSE-PSE-MK54-09C]|nr:S8 family serine peptidase [Kaiparowitsia implicata GSE-PSE-MK54-09C]